MSGLKAASQAQVLRPSTAPSSANKLNTRSVAATASETSQRSPGTSDTNVGHMHGKIRTLMKKRKKRKVSDRHEEEDLMKELLVNQQVEYLSRHTHFTLEEVRCLNEMFRLMTKKTAVPGEMDRPLFREVFQRQFGMTTDIMLDQMYYFFDADHEGSISLTEWVKNLSILLRGNLDEHIKYCYSIYDLNGDGGIGRQEVESLLQGCLLKAPGVDEEILENPRELVDIIMRKLDLEKSGQISLDSFRSAVYKDPLLLTTLGDCLPNAQHIRTFLFMFCEDYNDFTANYSLEGYPSYAYERQDDDDGVARSGSESDAKFLKSASSVSNESNKSKRNKTKPTGRNRNNRRSFGISLIHAVEKVDASYRKLERKSVVNVVSGV